MTHIAIQEALDGKAVNGWRGPGPDYAAKVG